MGSSKKEQYQNYQLQFASTAKALGHAARVAIIEHLSAYHVATNDDLRRLVQLNGSTVFQHLEVLMKAELIKEGFLDNQHFYTLNHTAKEQFSELLSVFDGGSRSKR